jgi:hypothetical protein
MRTANNRVQATPESACVFFLSQGSGAPEGDSEKSRAAIVSLPVIFHASAPTLAPGAEAGWCWLWGGRSWELLDGTV